MRECVTSLKSDGIFSLKDKVIFLTGAGGLGAAIAKGYLMNGARVILTNVTKGKGERIAAEFAREGLTNCEAFVMDQTKKADIERVVDQVIERYGKIDVLLNTVGAAVEFQAEAFPEEQLRRLIDIDLTSAILVTQVVGAKSMIPNRAGKIIHIGSIAGLMCHSSNSLPYEAAKAGLHQAVKSFAANWGKYNINVNAIAPTWVMTDLIGGFSKEYYDQVNEMHFFGRMAELSDFIGPAIFLASEASNYVSGVILPVDGAWSVGKMVNPKYTGRPTTLL